MPNDPTIAVYDAKAHDYDQLVSKDTPDCDLQSFIDAMPRGARVLDLGCGPGNSAAMMMAAGLQADASDASKKMVEIARTKFGIDAQLARFEDLNAIHTYDGIWANFSLLHSPKSQMPAHLSRIHTALKPMGLFHIGVKTGTGEATDSLGRFYAYYTADELTNLLTKAGFHTVKWRADTGPGLAGTDDPFIIMTAHA